MLLPILILPPDVNKSLNNLVDLANQKAFNPWVWKLIDATIAQFSSLPVAATTSGKINYLPNWLQQSPSKAYTGKYVYVFASVCKKANSIFRK